MSVSWPTPNAGTSSVQANAMPQRTVGAPVTAPVHGQRKERQNHQDGQGSVQVHQSEGVAGPEQEPQHENDRAGAHRQPARDGGHHEDTLEVDHKPSSPPMIRRITTSIKHRKHGTSVTRADFPESDQANSGPDILSPPDRTALAGRAQPRRARRSHTRGRWLPALPAPSARNRALGRQILERAV